MFHQNLIKSLVVPNFILLFSLSVYANNDNPPFVKGQVAVYATPSDLAGYNVVKYLPLSGISLVSVETGREWGLIQKLNAQGKNAHINLIANSTAIPNDEIYSFQWHMDSIQMEAAWDISTGLGVTIAVLDTGLNNAGPDGINCIVAPVDVVNQDNEPQDEDGHGTHVSGTIAQTTNNGIGVVGVAYDACIMPVKVLGADGSGSFADIAEGIYYAVDSGAQVVNMSLSTAARYNISNDPIMDPALIYAYNNQVTVFAASGNDGNRKNVGYPASFDTTIAVGSTDLNNKVPRYSNKGSKLDLVAPGGDTSKDQNNDGYADGVLQETFDSSGFSYFFYQGTSMATPHAAGVAALLIAHGITSPDDIYNRLTSTALDLGDTGFDTTYGHGLIQAYNALENIVDDGGGSGANNDADGDGYPADIDCDDNDASIYPGANDTRGKKGRDGIDNDCNGIKDG